VSDEHQSYIVARTGLGEGVEALIPKFNFPLSLLSGPIGPSMIVGSPNKDAVYAYADYWLSGPPGITVSEQGYYSPSTNIKTGTIFTLLAMRRS